MRAGFIRRHDPWVFDIVFYFGHPACIKYKSYGAILYTEDNPARCVARSGRICGELFAIFERVPIWGSRAGKNFGAAFSCQDGECIERLLVLNDGTALRQQAKTAEKQTLRRPQGGR
ncbi:MAG: hypothetical protein J2P49_05670 [Methylocapsa sp.]|nr:hypothetical protein [Methylocapsa sp.]